MTADKPKVVAYHINKENPEHKGVTLEPLIRLSDYEARQAEWFDALSRLGVIDRLGPEIRERLADGEIDLREAVEELNRLTKEAAL